MTATPRPNSIVPAIAPDSGGNGSGTSIPPSDGGLDDYLERRAHDQVIQTLLGDAPADGAINAADPISDAAWSRGLARHIDPMTGLDTRGPNHQ